MPYKAASQSPREEDRSPSKAQPPRQLLQAIVLTILPVLLIFGPLLLVDRSFATRDAAHFYHPLFQWTDTEWEAGRIPLWNSYENSGIPTVADATSSIFYPGKLLMALPIDFALEYKLYVVAHLLLAGLSTYYLARHWRASPAAAALAGIAFSAGGNVLFQYANVVFLVGASWLPLGLLALEGTICERSIRKTVLLAIVLAMMVLGGDPQAAYHLMLLGALLAALWCWKLVWSPSREPASPAPATADPASSIAQRWPVLLTSASLFAAAILVAGATAAIQILPSSAITKISERAAYNRPRNVMEMTQVVLHSPAPTIEQLAKSDYESPWQRTMRGLLGKPDTNAHHAIVYDFSIPPWRLIEFVWPNISGKPFPTNARWSTYKLREGRIWTPSMYLGFIPFVLGIAAVSIRSRDLRWRWLSWMVVWFGVGSFGLYGLGSLLQAIDEQLLGGDGNRLGIGDPVGGIYWLMVTFLPTYIYFRYPAKLMVVAVLALSLLAGISADQWLAQPHPRLRRVLQGLAIVSFLIACVALLMGHAMLSTITHHDSSTGPFDAASCRTTIVLSAIQTGMIAITLAALLGERCTVAARWRAPLVAVITVVDITLANSWLLQTADAEIWRKVPTTAVALHADRATSPLTPALELAPRVYRGRFAGWRPTSFSSTASLARSAETTAWESDTLFPKFMFRGNVSLCESYGSIKLLDYQSLMLIGLKYGPRQSDKFTILHPALLRMQGCEYLVLPDHYDASSFATKLTPTTELPESTSLWRMQKTLPRAWVVHRVEVLPPLVNPQDLTAVDNRSREVLFPENRARDFRRQATVETDRPLPFPELASRVGVAADATSLPPMSAAQIRKYDPQIIEIETTLQQPGLLVLSDLYLSDWVAEVTSDDGATTPIEIWPVNRVQRGIFLPAGTHHVRMRFASESLTRGAQWSLGSCVLLLAIFAGTWFIPREGRWLSR